MTPIPLFTSGEKPVSPNTEKSVGEDSRADLAAPKTELSNSPAAQDEKRRSDAHKGKDERPSDPRDEGLSKEEAERLYEERMEEEYAKREGGA